MKIKLFLFIATSVLILSSCVKDESTIPELTTNTVTEITGTSVKTGGNIISDGGKTITSMGVCWNTAPSPTTEDSKLTTQVVAGQFNLIISELEPITTYYVRAFAVNEKGTAYGNEISFTTMPPVPVVNFNGVQLWIHPADNATDIIWWSDTYVITGATSVTDGKTNTTTIVNTLGDGNYAAKICNDLVAFGYSDWYLPSRDELIRMEENKSEIGGFDTEKGYWSSTEYADYYAYVIYFNNGMYVNTMKHNEFNVRCVRK